MNQVTSTLNRFDIRCVESPYEPENTNVLWVTRDEFGRINSIKQFWNGAWAPTAVSTEVNEKLDKVNATAHAVKVTGSISSGTITCKDADYIPTTATGCLYSAVNSSGTYTWYAGKVKYDSTNTGTTEYYVAFFSPASGEEVPEDKIIDFVDTL
jgi:hypothetical protein